MAKKTERTTALKASHALASTMETKLVWASLCSVLDRDWTNVLSRDPNINQKPFKDIFKMMQTSFLERNPLIPRRLAALRIVKPKEEQISNF